MNILAIDCSFHGYSLAIAKQDEVFTSHQEEIKTDKNIINALDSLLEESKLKLTDINLLACAIGPGRFSGIRTACGTVQGISFVHNIKVAMIKSTLALAFANKATKSIVAYPAHRDHCYLAAYEISDNSIDEIIAPSLYAFDNLPSFEDDWEICLRGDINLDFINQKVSGKLTKIANQSENLTPAMIKLASKYIKDSQLVTANEVKPLYIRNKVALTKEERLAGMTL